MPIEFTCAGCQKILRVSEAAAGKRARCPDCGQINQVPVTGGFASAGETSGGSSWSTGDWSPNDPAQETGNPFASPHGYAQMGPVSLADVQNKLAGPAISLIVISIINLILMVFQFAVRSLAILGPGLQANQNGPDPDLMLGMGIFLAMLLVPMLRDIFVIYGAIQMKNMKSYSMALTATILSFLPCGCCFFQIPLAIWALVVLLDSDVKEAFSSAGAS